jgi:hypothetical protein
MRARALIDGASFGPDALKVVGQAYDLAWAKISHDFAGGPVYSRQPGSPWRPPFLSGQ